MRAKLHGPALEIREVPPKPVDDYGWVFATLHSLDPFQFRGASSYLAREKPVEVIECVHIVRPSYEPLGGGYAAYLSAARRPAIAPDETRLAAGDQ